MIVTVGVRYEQLSLEDDEAERTTSDGVTSDCRGLHSSDVQLTDAYSEHAARDKLPPDGDVSEFFVGSDDDVARFVDEDGGKDVEATWSKEVLSSAAGDDLPAAGGGGVETGDFWNSSDKDRGDDVMSFGAADDSESEASSPHSRCEEISSLGDACSKGQSSLAEPIDLSDSEHDQPQSVYQPGNEVTAGLNGIDQADGSVEQLPAQQQSEELSVIQDTEAEKHVSRMENQESDGNNEEELVDAVREQVTSGSECPLVAKNYASDADAQDQVCTEGSEVACEELSGEQLQHNYTAVAEPSCGQRPRVAAQPVITSAEDELQQQVNACFSGDAATVADDGQPNAGDHGPQKSVADDVDDNAAMENSFHRTDDNVDDDNADISITVNSSAQLNDVEPRDEVYLAGTGSVTGDSLVQGPANRTAVKNPLTDDDVAVQDSGDVCDVANDLLGERPEFGVLSHPQQNFNTVPDADEAAEICKATAAEDIDGDVDQPENSTCKLPTKPVDAAMENSYGEDSVNSSAQLNDNEVYLAEIGSVTDDSCVDGPVIDEGPAVKNPLINDDVAVQDSGDINDAADDLLDERPALGVLNQNFNAIPDTGEAADEAVDRPENSTSMLPTEPANAVQLNDIEQSDEVHLTESGSVTDDSLVEGPARRTAAKDSLVDDNVAVEDSGDIVDVAEDLRPILNFNSIPDTDEDAEIHENAKDLDEAVDQPENSTSKLPTEPADSSVYDDAVLTKCGRSEGLTSELVGVEVELAADAEVDAILSSGVVGQLMDELVRCCVRPVIVDQLDDTDAASQIPDISNTDTSLPTTNKELQLSPEQTPEPNDDDDVSDTSDSGTSEASGTGSPPLACTSEEPGIEDQFHRHRLTNDEEAGDAWSTQMQSIGTGYQPEIGKNTTAEECDAELKRTTSSNLENGSEIANSEADARFEERQKGIQQGTTVYVNSPGSKLAWRPCLLVCEPDKNAGHAKSSLPPNCRGVTASQLLDYRKFCEVRRNEATFSERLQNESEDEDENASYPFVDAEDDLPLEYLDAQERHGLLTKDNAPQECYHSKFYEGCFGEGLFQQKNAMEVKVDENEISLGKSFPVDGDLNESGKCSPDRDGARAGEVGKQCTDVDVSATTFDSACSKSDCFCWHYNLSITVGLLLRLECFKRWLGISKAI